MPSRSNRLCVSLMPESQEQLEHWLREDKEADLFEIRVDAFPKVDFKKVRAFTERPLICTCRMAEEGGVWKGPSRKRIPLFQAALDAGFDYVDVEARHFQEIVPALKKLQKGQLIVSRHSQQSEAKALHQELDELLQIPADVYKFIFWAKNVNDNAICFELVQKVRQRGVSYIIHAMGNEGQISRLLGAGLGNAWTYVAHSPGRQTASGQLTLQSARHHYFLHEKSQELRLCGLVGYPIGQSKGWRLHNLLFHTQLPRHQRNKFLYVNFPCPDFTEFWETWRPHLWGLSVTIPHKQVAVSVLDRVSIGVKISGVCNTIVRTSQGWVGHNTDLYAIESLLRRHREKLKNGAIVIGTGATARSAITALKRIGVYPIAVTGRNAEKGSELAQLFGVDFLTNAEAQGVNVSVIIQTTPVGMFPKSEEMAPGVEFLKRGRLVLDVVYNPPITRFLQKARELGCEVISGVEMFLLQAARQFELFTGHRISPEVIKEAWEKIMPFEIGSANA